MAHSCQAGAGSESKAGCSGGSAGTIYVQFWVANRVLEHHEHPPCLRPCTAYLLTRIVVNPWCNGTLVAKVPRDPPLSKYQPVLSCLFNACYYSRIDRKCVSGMANFRDGWIK